MSIITVDRKEVALKHFKEDIGMYPKTIDNVLERNGKDHETTNVFRIFNVALKRGNFGCGFQSPNLDIRICVCAILELKERLDENDKVIEKLLEENMKLKSNELD